MTDGGPLIALMKRGSVSPSDEMVDSVEDVSGSVAVIVNVVVTVSVRDVGGIGTVSGVRGELHATSVGTSDAGFAGSVDGWTSVETGDVGTDLVAPGRLEG